MRVVIVDAYRRNPVIITVLKKYETGAVYGDDRNGIRHYAPADKILPIPIPNK